MNSIATNDPSCQFQKLEANLERLKARVPDLPMTGIMLSRLLMHVGRGMATMLEQGIRPFGLTEAEFRVLMTLFSQPDGIAHPSELCARTSQSPANMSRITDALVERDLITRLPSVHDRRKLVLHITPRGDELVSRLLPTISLPLCAMLKDFSEAEQQQLIAQLKRLGSSLTESCAQAPRAPAV